MRDRKGKYRGGTAPREREYHVTMKKKTINWITG